MFLNGIFTYKPTILRYSTPILGNLHMGLCWNTEVSARKKKGESPQL